MGSLHVCRWGGPDPALAEGRQPDEGRTASRPADCMTTADSCPEMNVSGASASSTRLDRGRGRGARPERPRRLACSRPGRTRAFGRARRSPARQPVEQRSAPGASSNASLRLAGSLSAPLVATTRRRREPGDRPPLGATGNHAPPWPRAACLELVDQPVRLVMELAPSVEMVPNPGSGAPPPTSPCSRRVAPSGALRTSWRRVRLNAPNLPRAGRSACRRQDSATGSWSG